MKKSKLIRVSGKDVAIALKQKSVNFFSVSLLCLGMLLNSSCKKDDDPKTYPTDGLVSYFNFNDNLKDVMAVTPEGTNTGSTPFVAGKNGKAISFNGTSQMIEFDKQVFSSSNNFSISIWVKQEVAGGTNYIGGNGSFGVFTENDKVGMAVFIGSEQHTNSAYGTLKINEWTHLVGTYDGTNIITYVDGVLSNTTNFPGDINIVKSNLTLGHFNGYWKGSIDDFFIYDKVLTQAEITQLYNYSK